MQLRTTPNPVHRLIGSYPGHPRFDQFLAERDQLANDLYDSLLYAGITPTHKVYIPWAVGFVDVTDPTAWNNNGKICCYWLSLDSSIEHPNQWKDPDAIIFEQILDI